MTTINTASATAFRTAMQGATTKAEVSHALGQLDKAADLSPSEKVSLALEFKDRVSSGAMGHGVDGALNHFVQSQGTPVGPKNSPLMARMGNVLANSAKELSALVDDVANLGRGAKGANVSPGDLSAIKTKLEAAFQKVDHADDDLKALANNISKGSETSITEGDVNAVRTQLQGWFKNDMKPVLDAISGGSVRTVKAKLPDAVASLVRAADMAKHTKEIGTIAEEQVAVGKGGNVATPSPFEPAPTRSGGGNAFHNLKPDATVLSRTTKENLKFAEQKLEQWHDTSAVSDHDVSVVRNTLSEVFQLPRNQFLALNKTGGDSALTSGHLLAGEVKDVRTGSVVGKFTADLNTGAIDVSAVRVGK